MLNNTIVVQLSKAIALIQHPINKQINTWADLGCGNGLFTKALSNLLADGSLIYAVDKNKSALNKITLKTGIQLEKLVLDFIHDDLPFKNLSGILMANTFHFVKNKNAFINKAFKCLNDDGYLLIVEYDTDKSNYWVPYAISYKSLEKLFKVFNYTTQKLNEMPSRFNGVIYSAIVTR
ncbi:MAG TPA: methyltransferase domain-containing protein [Parafilimonas sp.]